MMYCVRVRTGRFIVASARTAGLVLFGPEVPQNTRSHGVRDTRDLKNSVHLGSRERLCTRLAKHLVEQFHVRVDFGVGNVRL